MGITATFSEPYYQAHLSPGGPEGPGTTGVVFDVSLNGRPYFVDTATGDFRHQSIPLVRQQADASDAPGEQTLNPEDLWRRSIDSWHRGAGQIYLDARDSNEGQYHLSKGIDPWEQGQITLLHETTRKRTTGNASVQLVVAGHTLYMLDGTGFVFTDDVTGGSISWTSPAQVGAAALGSSGSIASDGYHVWVTTPTDLNYTTRGATTYRRWLAPGSQMPGNLVRYAKGFLLVANGRELWNVLAQGSVKPTDAFFEHPNPDWQWTDIAEGPAAIYMAGYAGDKSAIYRTTFSTALSSLDVPIQTVSLPDGELVRSLCGYLGFLLIGTDKGLRFATVRGDGGVELGDLIEINAAVNCFEPQGRFVWFGWSNYDNDSSGLGRLDLRTLNGTQPAFATDLMAETQGAVLSVVTFQDRRVFSIAQNGVWVESNDYVETGTIDSGLIGFGISSGKTALFLETQHRKGEGTYQPALATDEGTFVPAGSIIGTTLNSAHVETTAVGQQSGELFEIRYTLGRSSFFANRAPVLGRFTLRADPAAPRRFKIQVPIVLAENVQGEPYDVAAERQRIRGLASTRAPVPYIEGDTAYVVIVEDFTWLAHASQGFPSYDYSGTLTVVLKTVN